MKKNCCLILVGMMATGAVAQASTNDLMSAPPPTLNAPAAPVAPANEAAPAKKSAPKAAVKHKKKVVAKAEAKPVIKVAESSTPLMPGPATVAAENLNLRGQAGLKGEVVGRAKKGDTVMVIFEITLDKHAANEPAHWAKIALPAGTKVWVNSKFIDEKNKIVSAKKLNLRGGPGENYSVLGVLEQGTAITAVTSKGDWTQIEAPASAFAFVAANYLRQENPAIASANPAPPVEPMPATPSVVPEPPPIVAQPPVTIPPTAQVPVPVPTAPPVITPPNIVETNNITMADTNLPPLPPRIVSHEGNVRASVSPVAPTFFELYDPITGNAINYLYSTTTNLSLARYDGLRVVVTGEEGLDSRWKETPVLTIQKIIVVPQLPVEKVRIVTSPRASQRH